MSLAIDGIVGFERLLIEETGQKSGLPRKKMKG
jgi:hypothetical protein